MDRFACTKRHSTCSTHPNSLTAPRPHEVGATFIPITQMRTPRSTAASSSGVPASLWQSPALPHSPTLPLKLAQKVRSPPLVHFNRRRQASVCSSNRETFHLQQLSKPGFQPFILLSVLSRGTNDHHINKSRNLLPNFHSPDFSATLKNKQ